jgi:hypothetical protein
MPGKKKHGGPRKGAGRKPVTDPKIQVNLFIEKSIFDANGGVDEIREACYHFLRSRLLAKDKP